MTEVGVQKIAKKFKKLGPRTTDPVLYELGRDGRILYTYLKDYHPGAKITPEFITAILQKLQEREIWPTTMGKILSDYKDLIDDELETAGERSDEENLDLHPGAFGEIYEKYKEIMSIAEIKPISDSKLFPFYNFLHVLAERGLWPPDFEQILHLQEDEVQEIIGELAA